MEPKPAEGDGVRPADDPDVLGNYQYWRDYAWPEGGDEWSEPWGGTDQLWFTMLQPRLFRFLPAGHILEIAPGFGRLTNYLRRYADRLTVVDLVPRCIEECRRRFAADTHITYHVNDGMSLGMVPDHSVDFAISFDSLVHAGQSAISSYTRELKRVLKPGAFAFIHHANLGQYAAQLTGQETGKVVCGRRKDQTAAQMRSECKQLGLRVISQELIPWGQSDMLIDCFTLLMRDDSYPRVPPPPPVIVERPDWWAELKNSARLAGMYRRPGGVL